METPRSFKKGKGQTPPPDGCQLREQIEDIRTAGKLALNQGAGRGLNRAVTYNTGKGNNNLRGKGKRSTNGPQTPATSTTVTPFDQVSTKPLTDSSMAEIDWAAVYAIAMNDTLNQ